MVVEYSIQNSALEKYKLNPEPKVDGADTGRIITQCYAHLSELEQKARQSKSKPVIPL